MLVSGSCLKPDSAHFNTLLSVIPRDVLLIWLKEIHGFAIKQKGIINVDSIDDDKLRAYIVPGLYANSPLLARLSPKDTQLLRLLILSTTKTQTESDSENNSRLKQLKDLFNFRGHDICNMGIHGHAYRVGFESATAVNNALIDMYARKNKIKLSERVFKRTPGKDVVC
ncbi:hypothetical protein IFM89_031178 [Coptis chinensis]|uniref:Uncharacterized protein n=1 Tax=Coptis chinensis TaxID=261450 RepID=A0A835M7Q5_9MAGN|nr:hypothetical protein IFM89_031178 [Coptis chinensis]